MIIFVPCWVQVFINMYDFNNDPGLGFGSTALLPASCKGEHA